MTRYRIEFEAPITLYAYATVEAESESAARQAYIDGDIDDWDIVAGTLESFDAVTSLPGAHVTGVKVDE